jgi:hypothetical protein
MAGALDKENAAPRCSTRRQMPDSRTALPPAVHVAIPSTPAVAVTMPPHWRHQAAIASTGARQRRDWRGLRSPTTDCQQERCDCQRKNSPCHFLFSLSFSIGANLCQRITLKNDGGSATALFCIHERIVRIVSSRRQCCELTCCCRLQADDCGGQAQEIKTSRPVQICLGRICRGRRLRRGGVICRTERLAARAGRFRRAQRRGHRKIQSQATCPR